MYLYSPLIDIEIIVFFSSAAKMYLLLHSTWIEKICHMFFSRAAKFFEMLFFYLHRTAKLIFCCCFYALGFFCIVLGSKIYVTNIFEILFFYKIIFQIIFCCIELERFFQVVLHLFFSTNVDFYFLCFDFCMSLLRVLVF